MYLFFLREFSRRVKQYGVWAYIVKWECVEYLVSAVEINVDHHATKSPGCIVKGYRVVFALTLTAPFDQIEVA